MQIVTSGPDNPLEAIHRMHVAAIHSAAQRAWLTTPYFVPGEPALMALTSAALRGVDVRLLVPRRSDSLIVSAAARSYYDELIAAGVKVWEYKARMLHSKTLVVDDNCAMIGTANFDNRSFRLNFEVMAVVYGPALARPLAAQFETDLHSAVAVRGQPAASPSGAASAMRRRACFSPLALTMPHTFLWHDYETFGAVPRRDRPAQFAGIRTDAELNEIGEPLMLYCQPAPDFLPEPGGLPDHRHHAAAVPGARRARARVRRARSSARSRSPAPSASATTRIRFDDEVTRFLFWRNLIDPYAREWQNDCGRWDLLDVVRLTYALRPEGIEWPKQEDGTPSFKLEDLARANGLLHEAAHDALSDVRATIALARLIRDRQPKLFDFASACTRRTASPASWACRRRATARKPFLHVSGMFPAERGCLAVMWPLASHPTNKNELLVWDLAHDPAELRDARRRRRCASACSRAAPSCPKA